MFISKTGRTMGLVGAAVVAVVLLAQGVNAQQRGTFTDSRDGKTYRTVKIGNLTWMAENLNHQIGESWCYDDDNSNCAKYGRLYTWDAAMKACPAGWRLPVNQDWNALVQVAGGDNAGTQLKSKDGWNDGGNGTDVHGFSALPSGNRYTGGSFHSVGYLGDWWTATEYGSDDAYYRYMGTGYTDVNEDTDGKSYGFSVRCVRND